MKMSQGTVASFKAPSLIMISRVARKMGKKDLLCDTFTDYTPRGYKCISIENNRARGSNRGSRLPGSRTNMSPVAVATHSSE